MVTCESSLERFGVFVEPGWIAGSETILTKKERLCSRVAFFLLSRILANSSMTSYVTYNTLITYSLSLTLVFNKSITLHSNISDRNSVITLHAMSVNIWKIHGTDSHKIWQILNFSIKFKYTGLTSWSYICHWNLKLMEGVTRWYTFPLIQRQGVGSGWYLWDFSGCIEYDPYKGGYPRIVWLISH